jgi:leucyl-tRNA synthetase
LAHRVTKRVTDDLERFRYNTMLASMMEAANALTRLRGAVSQRTWREASERLVLLIAPSAPHLAEELWHRLGHEESVHLQTWPEYDPALIMDRQVTLVIQVNGKVRDRIEVPVDISEEEAQKLAAESPRVQAHISGATVRQVVYVPGKLVNLVVG